MNKQFYILKSLISSLMFYSSLLGTVDSPDQDRAQNIVNAPLMPNDPNFDPNWDWTLNERYDLYVLGANGIISYPNIDLPYFSIYGPAGEKFHNDTTGVRDIYPRDGWVLLFRDFGTPTRGVPIPNFILYIGTEES